MKCTKCHKYVTEPYKGCKWCAIPESVKLQIDGLEAIADKCRELANLKRSWLGYETIIKECAELRIDIYNQAQKELQEA